uniref:Uncharacterized protein n=1 Tax=viral metagenome TaxID=1070528 RepID=A0A6C0AIL1_9ZZZZ
MPSHLVSLPGARGPASGVPLGAKLTHVSVSAVHGETKKATVVASKPVLAAVKARVPAPVHAVSTPKTH